MVLSALSKRDRKLLFVGTEDWAFLTHRLPMARAAQAAGWEIHVATRVETRGEEIRSLGYILHPLRWHRRSLSPLAILRETLELRALYRREAFTVIHQNALKPIVVGSLAATGCGLPTVNSIAGLGYLFTSRHWRARVLSAGMTIALRRLLNRPTSVAVVQNPDDRDASAVDRRQGRSGSHSYQVPVSILRRFAPVPNLMVPLGSPLSAGCWTTKACELWSQPIVCCVNVASI